MLRLLHDGIVLEHTPVLESNGATAMTPPDLVGIPAMGIVTQ